MIYGMRKLGRSDLAFRLAGIWVMLNASIIAVAAALAFHGHDLIFRAAGVGPKRVAIADLFHPFQSLTGFFLVGLAIAVAAIGVGLIRRQAWTRIVLLIVLTAALAGTLVAIGWGLSNADSGVVWGGLIKVALYVACLVILTRPIVIRAFKRVERASNEHSLSQVGGCGQL